MATVDVRRSEPGTCPGAVETGSAQLELRGHRGSHRRDHRAQVRQRGRPRSARPGAHGHLADRRRLGHRELPRDADPRHAPGPARVRSTSTRSARDLDGTVESFGGATGSRYSVLPPENATGNYVKVVQRIPVRIRLDPGQPGIDRLRAGDVGRAEGDGAITTRRGACASGAARLLHDGLDGRAQPVGHRARRHDGDVHGGARHEHRERLAAAHRRQPLREPGREHVGAHVVPRVERDRAARSAAGSPTKLGRKRFYMTCVAMFTV